MKKEISAVLIARDEEAVIGRCLRSLTGVDEIVVLDTGSKDRTAEICEGFGARVFREDPSEEPFHFGEARNRALAKCQTPWVISIDADEVMRPGWNLKLRKAIDRRPDLLGFLITFIDHPPGGIRTYTEAKLRVFRADSWTWKYRVHEKLTPKMSQRPDIGDLTSAVFMEHLPDPEKPRRDRNLALLELCVRESPDHLIAYWKLGREYMLAKRWEEAIPHLSRYAETASDGPVATSEALSDVGRSLAELGRVDEALEWFTKATEVCSDRREPFFYAALVLIKSCRLEEALKWIARMEGIPERKRPGSPYDLLNVWKDEPARMRRFCEEEIARAKAAFKALHRE